MSSGQQTTALATIGGGQFGEADAFMPVMSIEQAVGRYNAVVEFAQRVMKRGRDYGTIPGTEAKRGGGDDGTPSNKSDTLLKPGAEKLCSLFGLVPEFVDYRVVEDWDKGLFYYGYLCRLSRKGQLVSTGIGSANSREKKYRRMKVTCPACGKAAIARSKFPPRDSGRPKSEGGWWCGTREGGCGANFVADDPAITSQSGQVDAMAAADQINTLQKMAQKRALVAATLTATNASEFFTQDVEDMEIIDGEVLPPSAGRGRPAAEPAEATLDEDDGQPQTRQEWFLAQWDELAVARGLNGSSRGVLGAVARKRKLATDINTWTDEQCREVMAALRNASDEQVTSLKAGGKPAPAAPPPATAPTSATPIAEPPVTEQLVADWGEFETLVISSAINRGVDGEVARAGLDRAVVATGKDDADLPNAWRAAFLHDVRANLIDFATGKRRPAAAAATAA